MRSISRKICGTLARNMVENAARFRIAFGVRNQSIGHLLEFIQVDEPSLFDLELEPASASQSLDRRSAKDLNFRLVDFVGEATSQLFRDRLVIQVGLCVRFSKLSRMRKLDP